VGEKYSGLSQRGCSVNYELLLSQSNIWNRQRDHFGPMEWEATTRGNERRVGRQCGPVNLGLSKGRVTNF
jgi:hypothetical protein